MQARRGFTLIEVLVALGLLMVISSLALPVALTNTEAARARTAERILTLAPGVARGQAQRSGGPVALVLAPQDDADGPLRLLIVREPDPARGDAADQNADPGDVSTWPSVAEPRDLPRGTRLWEGGVEQLEAFEAQAQAQVRAQAQTRGVGASAQGPMAPRAFTEDDAQASPMGMGEPMDAVVLAWYLSDGSAMAGRATAVRLADGRVVRARVEPLEGRLVFTPAPELEEGAAAPLDEEGEPLEDGAGVEPADAHGGDGMDPTSEPGKMGLDALEFERPEFENPQFDMMEFESREFDDLALDALEFDRPEFENSQLDMMEFESREFDDLAFDALEFDRLEFDELGDPGAGGDRRDESQEQKRDEGDRANPEPPQPR